MTRCLPFFLGLLLSTGAIAQPAGPPVPTANAEAKTKQAHAQLTRKLKEAIREGFKHHDAEMHWSIFSEQATFTFGRTRTPDSRDYTRARKEEADYLKRMWSIPVSGQEDVYFRKLQIERKVDRIEVYLEIAFHFFGGNRIEGREYVFEPGGSGAPPKALRLRSWPLFQAMGPDIKKYTPAFWKGADERAEKAVNEKDRPLAYRLTYLIEARWIAKALQLAKIEVKNNPRNVEAWKAVGALSFELGDHVSSKSATRTARKLNPKVELPKALQ